MSNVPHVQANFVYFVIFQAGIGYSPIPEAVLALTKIPLEPPDNQAVQRAWKGLILSLWEPVTITVDGVWDCINGFLRAIDDEGEW